MYSVIRVKLDHFSLENVRMEHQTNENMKHRCIIFKSTKKKNITTTTNKPHHNDKKRETFQRNFEDAMPVLQTPFQTPMKEHMKSNRKTLSKNPQGE